MSPLEVMLPCCEVCGRVGRRPSVAQSVATFCTGSKERRHARAKMEDRLFREVIPQTLREAA